LKESCFTIYLRLPHESAIGIRVSPPSGTSLPAPTPSPDTGEECTDPRKTWEGAGRREQEETEQDQACTRDSRWGWGDRSRGPIPHQEDCSGQRAGIRGSWRAQQLTRDRLRLKGLRTMWTVPAAALRTPDRDARTLKRAAAGCWAVGIGSELNPRARSALPVGRGPRKT